MDCSTCKTITGPVCMYRLEQTEQASDDTVKKIFYNLGDIHLDVDEQLESRTIAPVIDQYLDSIFRSLKDTDPMLDFFVEYGPSSKKDHENKKHHRLQQYIAKVERMIYSRHLSSNKMPNSFSRKRSIESADTLPSTIASNDCVIIQDKWPRVRFHVFDFRDLLDLDGLGDCHGRLTIYGSGFMRKYKREFEKKFDQESFDKIIETLEWYVVNVIDVLKLSVDELNRMTDVDLGNKQQLFLLVKKFKTKYAHQQDLASTMNRLFDAYTATLESSIKRWIDDFKSILALEGKYPKIDDYTKRSTIDFATYDFEYNSYGTDLVEKKHAYEIIKYRIDVSWNMIFDSIMVITDLFLIKRFLNKDYIEHSLSYTGFAHSVHYVYILVKYFGFTITHADYCDVQLPELNKLIKESSDSVNGITTRNEIAYCLSKPMITQVVDVSGFPKLFT